MKKGIVIILILIIAGLTYLMVVKTKVVEIDGSVKVSSLGTSEIRIQWSMTPSVSAQVKEIPMLQYYISNRGKLKSSSSTVSTPEVVEIYIYFKLITPANKTIEFEPLSLKGAGEHTFNTIIGPNEGLEEGLLKLVFEFNLKVKTPTGLNVVELLIRVSLDVNTETAEVSEPTIEVIKQ